MGLAAKAGLHAPGAIRPYERFQKPDPRTVNTTRRIVEKFLQRSGARSDETLRTYAKGLKAFDDFCETEHGAGLAYVLTANFATAEELISRYIRRMVELDYSEPTIDIRFRTLRQFLIFAKRKSAQAARTKSGLGLQIKYEMDDLFEDMTLPFKKPSPRRDTRGPSVANIQRLLTETSKDRSEKGRRDFAILQLLYSMTPRRQEVCAIDMTDLDMSTGEVAMTCKGHSKSDREWKRIPPMALKAIADYLEMRGRAPGPLFRSLSRRTSKSEPGRLTGDGLARIIRNRGKAIGLTGLITHGFRHTSATTAYQETGNLAAVASLLNHSDTTTARRYAHIDKKRQAYEVSEMLERKLKQCPRSSA